MLLQAFSGLDSPICFCRLFAGLDSPICFCRLFLGWIAPLACTSSPPKKHTEPLVLALPHPKVCNEKRCLSSHPKKKHRTTGACTCMYWTAQPNPLVKKGATQPKKNTQNHWCMHLHILDSPAPSQEVSNEEGGPM